MKPSVKKIIKRVGAELAADPEFAPHIIETLKMQGVEQFGDFAVHNPDEDDDQTG